MGTNVSMAGKQKVLLTYQIYSAYFTEKLTVVESLSLRIILACLRLVSFFDQVYYCLVFLIKKYSIISLGWLTCQIPITYIFTILSIPNFIQSSNCKMHEKSRIWLLQGFLTIQLNT